MIAIRIGPTVRMVRVLTALQGHLEHWGHVLPWTLSVGIEAILVSIVMHSTSQHSTTRRSDRTFHHSTQYHMAVRSYIPPFNTVPHGGQIVHSTSQHSTTWRSDRTFHQSTQYHTAAIPNSIPSEQLLII